MLTPSHAAPNISARSRTGATQRCVPQVACVSLTRSRQGSDGSGRLGGASSSKRCAHSSSRASPAPPSRHRLPRTRIFRTLFPRTCRPHFLTPPGVSGCPHVGRARHCHHGQADGQRHAPRRRRRHPRRLGRVCQGTRVLQHFWRQSRVRCGGRCSLRRPCRRASQGGEKPRGARWPDGGPQPEGAPWPTQRGWRRRVCV